MKPLFAIIGLTLKNALRSHVFQLLLLTLVLSIIVIPMSIGGGSAQDFIRVSLLYSTWTIVVILALSSLYLGCFVMAQDVDNYQLHMVASKPVSRIVIWLGKWIGVNIINFTLLLIATAVVYSVVMYRYNVDDNFSEEERKLIASEVLVGRRVFLPERPDFNTEAQARFLKRIREEKKKYSREEQDQIFSQELQKVIGEYSELSPDGKPKEWVFRNLPPVGDAPLFLRFRPYISKISSEDQRMTYVQWSVIEFMDGAQDAAGNKIVAAEIESKLSDKEQLFTGEFHEKRISSKRCISSEGEARFRVYNHDPDKAKQIYQPADGPKLLLQVCSFEENYLRMVMVTMIQLMLLSGLACAFGGFLTMPTAVFVVISYLLLGSFCMILTDTSFFAESSFDLFGQGLAKALLIVVIPLQSFDVTELLSTGELIEFSLIGKLFLDYFVLRGLPWFIFGIFMYWRRELGLALRK